MFTTFATAPARLKGGIVFGMLLTALPAAAILAAIAYAGVNPPHTGGAWAGVVFTIVVAGVFVLAGALGTRRLLAGDGRGAYVFSRPAYPLLAVCVLGLLRQLLFDPERSAGGIVGALVLTAFVASVLFYFRWLASSMPGSERPPTGTDVENSPLVRVVREACAAAADVKLGDLPPDTAARRLVDEAGGSHEVLANATRILTDQVGESKGEVRAISEVAARLADRARQLVANT